MNKSALEEKMSKYWSKTIKNLEVYVPGEQPKDKKYIKLNTNENPYPPSPRVIEAIKRAANTDLRLYPDPNGDELCNTIAQYYNLKSDQVFVGNGSDEILGFSFGAFFDPENVILFPDITYSFYPVYADLFHLAYKKIPVDNTFTIQVEQYLIDNGGIVISNPNAPTSKYLPNDQIVRIIEHNYRCERVVIIDEAYIDFGGESIVKYIEKYPNLLVVQTFSKSRSLAGLRIGFALGHKDLIEGLNRIKNSFNSYTLDRMALIGGKEAFLDDQYFKETTQKIISTRDWVSRRLASMGCEVIDSKANFIFISHPSIYAGELFKKLRERGVLVRYFNKPRIDNYLRVSIGSDNEMKVFCDLMEQIAG